MNDDPRHLVALEQCGLELQAPHLRTTMKRRIETSEVDAAIAARPTASDSSAGHPRRSRRAFPVSTRRPRTSSRPPTSASGDVRRVVAMTSRGEALHPRDRARAGDRDDRPGRGAAGGVCGRDARRGHRAGRWAGRRAVRAAAVLVPAAGAGDHGRRRFARRAHRHGRGAGRVRRGRGAGARDRRRGHDRRLDRRCGPLPRSRCTRACRSADRGASRSRRAMRRRPPRSSWTRATSRAACASCRRRPSAWT